MKGHGQLNRERLLGQYAVQSPSGHAQGMNCANIHLKVEKFFTIGRPYIFRVAKGVIALSGLHACRR